MDYGDFQTRAKEEYKTPSEYYKDLYYYIKKRGVSILRFIRDEKFLKNPRESLENILDFYVSIGIIKKEAEKDFPNYWRNGVVRFCDIAMKKTIDKLLNFIQEE